MTFTMMCAAATAPIVLVTKADFQLSHQKSRGRSVDDAMKM
jgi:hypothetical protein